MRAALFCNMHFNCLVQPIDNLAGSLFAYPDYHNIDCVFVCIPNSLPEIKDKRKDSVHYHAATGFHLKHRLY
jgi:hypothetical protein